MDEYSNSKGGYSPKMQYGYKVEIEKLPLEFNGKSEVTISEMSSEANKKEHRLSKLSLLQKQIEKKNNRQLVVLTA